VSGDSVPVGDFDLTQLRRVRALQIACVLFSGTTYDVRVNVARWIMTGVWHAE